jgi:hypothetical protein
MEPPKNRLVAHHPDYLKPLLIWWLCDPCHRKQHAKKWRKLPFDDGILDTVLDIKSDKEQAVSHYNRCFELTGTIRGQNRNFY